MYLSTFLNKKNVKIYVEICLTCAMNPQSIKLDVEYPFHEQYLSVYDCKVYHSNLILNLGEGSLVRRSS